MRPPKQPQDSLLLPLNEIFGTQANVRLLRVLSLEKTSLTAGELAKRAMLGRTSIYPAMRELERAGVLELIGTGSRKLVQLRERHPLAPSLRELFRAEHSRLDDLAMALRKLLATWTRAPISAWLDHRPAGEDDPVRGTDTLSLYVVARPEELNSLVDHLNDRLADIERRYDVPIAVHGLMRSELETLQKLTPEIFSNLVLLAGVPPSALLPRLRPAGYKAALVSHDEHDARSRRLAIAISEKIKRDPALIAIAEERVKRRAREASPQERRELMEWDRVLSTMSPARLQRFLLENSERAVRLRQTLPALNLLSPVEREAVRLSQTDGEVRAAIRRG